MRQKAAGLLCLLLLLCCILPCAHTEEPLPRRERALLVGVDEFVSQPSAYPSSTNNVYAMQEMFQGAADPLEAILLPPEPVTSAQQLTALIQAAFSQATAEDVSYLYISTHGLYDPETGLEPQLLLSDGVVEGSITPAQLEAAFDGIPGTKVIILDACNSGAFIGKGLSHQPEELHFLGEDFKVLTSSGALEESWYWNSEDGGNEQGAFYFTQALTQALSPVFDYPADQNRDGAITLQELHQHLLQGHAASTPQVYPQKDDFILFRYDATQTAQRNRPRAPIMDVTFSGNTLSRPNPELTIEFIAMRPVQVGYQIVYQREGKWQFDQAQIIYDEAERFTVFGDQAGAVSPGRKVRTLSIGELPQDAYGFSKLVMSKFINGQGKEGKKIFNPIIFGLFGPFEDYTFKFISNACMKNLLGMPIVISVAFFVVYYIISISGEKFAKEGTWSSLTGMWFPAMIGFLLKKAFRLPLYKNSLL